MIFCSVYHFWSTHLHYFLLTVDTILHFFRAYYDKGHLIYSLPTIRKNYIRSGWFFFNLLSSIPTGLLVYIGTAKDIETLVETDGISFHRWDGIILLLDAFKLLRLLRLKKLMKQSYLITTYSERVNVKVASEFV